MGKLHFRYGAMSCSKTALLLMTAYNYESKGKKVLVMKPIIDDRYGKKTVKSRAGLEREADILLSANTRLKNEELVGIDCILVDECQFLSKFVVDQLREISQQKDIPVICYGLRTDFRTKLFEGSKRLLEISDSIEEVRTACYFCDKKAILNLKQIDGKAVIDGDSIQVGGDTLYYAVCYFHYCKKLHEAEHLLY